MNKTFLLFLNRAISPLLSLMIGLHAGTVMAAQKGEPDAPPGLLQVPRDSEIEIELRNGKTYAGRLVDASQKPEGFGLRAERGSSISDAHAVAYREFAYDDIDRYVIKKLKDWAAPEVAAGIPQGQRIELRFLNGERTKGRLAEAADEGFWLEDNPVMFRFDEVEQLKYRRGPALKIVLITVGAFVAVSLFLGATIGRQGGT